MESSLFWNTTGVGDGPTGYGESDLTEWMRQSIISSQQGSEGVLAGVGGQLAVSGTTSPLSVAAGSAYVQGIFYQNTSPVSLSLATPAGTTGHRVVLRADYAANTVRVTLLSSPDGTSSAPALTQSAGSTWDISLATLTIDSNGDVVVTDARDYCHFGAALVNRRRGGSASNWATAGSASYTPGGMFTQMGAVSLHWDDDEDSDKKTITFPRAFSGTPLVFLTMLNGGSTKARRANATIEEISASSVKVRAILTDDDDDYDGDHTLLWRAVGPR